MNTSPETQRPHIEREQSTSKDLEKAAHERRETLRQEHERAQERNNEKTDEARREALEKAKSIETLGEKEHAPSSSERRVVDRIIGQKDRNASFTTTMEDVRQHMTPASRSFSRIIHNKTIEQVSDAAGSTIARPNAILSGSIAAFALTLALYLIAKNLGYVLSGFETIGAFVLGWILGITFDFLKVMITGRK